MSIRVAASLWSTPPAEVASQARRLAAAGLRRWHWDVSDGRFAAPGGFTPPTVDQVTRATGIPGEAHLMVLEPLAQLEDWLTVCDTVAVHVESSDWQQAVECTLKAGRAAAVAISPTTPLSALEGLDENIGILVMSITPGQSPSRFLPSTLERLSALRGRELLGVDGGVTLPLAYECSDHGATWLISGSDLCGSPDPSAWIASVTAG